MIRRALFRCPPLRCYNSHVFLSTPNPVAKCPFTGNLTESKVKSTIVQNDISVNCPILGVTPELRCPIETEQFVKKQPLTKLASQMGKMRLSVFVTATSVAGYVICGGSSPIIASAITAGTLLQCLSANTANQIIEVEHDKKMKRTCRRPMPMGYISKSSASALCVSELIVGSSILFFVSPSVSLLGICNWLLYVVVYTPLKRVSAINTWVGSIVGGIPPLMGGIASVGNITGPAWLLAFLLVAWQIPHFMGLSFHCRRDYEAAGYKMLAFYNPWRASFYAVLLSVVMTFITLVGPTFVEMHVESWYYPVVAAANIIMIYKAWLFHCEPKLHCRGCFVFSYVYLTMILAALMMNHFEPVKKCVATSQYIISLVKDDDKETLSLD